MGLYLPTKLSLCSWSERQGSVWKQSCPGVGVERENPSKGIAFPAATDGTTGHYRRHREGTGIGARGRSGGEEKGSERKPNIWQRIARSSK